MHADGEHAGREQAGIVDAHRVHPSLGDLHVAGTALLGLLGGPQWVEDNTAAGVLVSEGDRIDDTTPELGGLRLRQLTQDVVLHEWNDLLETLSFVVVRIDIDDEYVVEVALHGLLAGMRQQPTGIEYLDANPPSAVSDQVDCFHLGFSIDPESPMSSSGEALPDAKFEHPEIRRAKKSTANHHDVGRR